MRISKQVWHFLFFSKMLRFSWALWVLALVLVLYKNLYPYIYIYIYGVFIDLLSPEKTTISQQNEVFNLLSSIWPNRNIELIQINLMHGTNWQRRKRRTFSLEFNMKVKHFKYLFFERWNLSERIKYFFSIDRFLYEKKKKLAPPCWKLIIEAMLQHHLEDLLWTCSPCVASIVLPHPVFQKGDLRQIYYDICM